MDSTQVPQEPVTFPIDARAVVLPSLPTTLPRRTSSLVSRSFRSMISFKVAAISLLMPFRFARRRTLKSPFLKALSVFNSVSAQAQSPARFVNRRPFLHHRAEPPAIGSSQAGRIVIGTLLLKAKQKQASCHLKELP